MPKWKVKYEIRNYYEMVVEAETHEEAEQKVCDESWRRHRSDIYAISETEQLDGKVHKIYDYD